MALGFSRRNMARVRQSRGPEDMGLDLEGLGLEAGQMASYEFELAFPRNAMG